MDLQAIRYAAMVYKMTFAAAIQAHRSYLQQRGLEGDADSAILEFLGWDEPQEEEFANDVRIVLASGEFSKELMTAVMWLTQYDIDIRCIRLKPYKLGDQVLLDVQQILPLPEAEDIWIKIRGKEREERRARVQSRDFTRFDLTIGDQVFTNLPKRRLIFHVIREAVRRGNAPRQVMDSNRKWVAVLGEHDHDTFIARSVEHREPESSSSEIGRFFTEDDELMRWEGKTYALTKMWGLKTQEYVDEIIQELNLDNISYKETE